MARDPKRARIDYTPCHAARAVLDEADAITGHRLSKQALIDKLLVWGLWCAKKEQDRPPPLHGTNRSYWRRTPERSADVAAMAEKQSDASMVPEQRTRRAG